MNPHTRRQFFTNGSHLLGGAALTSLLGEAMSRQALGSESGASGPHFAPKAKRVIYLHMVGGPSQLDLFDYKPEMQKWYDKDLPESIRKGQPLTTMTSGQARFPKETFEGVADGKVARLDNFSSAGLWGGRRARKLRSRGIDKGQAAELEAFVHAVRTGFPMPIGLTDLVATTRATVAVSRALAGRRTEPIKP